MSTINSDFIGLVLAGGQSSRMGQDKAELVINGTTLLERSVTLLQQLGSTEVLVSRNNFSIGSLPDIYPNHGPLSGIHAAIFYSSKPVLCIPVDMPLLDIESLKDLVLNGQAMDTCVHYVNHNLPLFVPNNDSNRIYLEQVLSTKNTNTSVKRFLTVVGHAQLKAQNNNNLVNTNTPEQWQSVLKTHSQQHN